MEQEIFDYDEQAEINLNRLKVVRTGGCGRKVYLDGKEFENIARIDIHYQAGDLPTFSLEYFDYPLKTRDDNIVRSIVDYEDSQLNHNLTTYNFDKDR